MKKLLFLVVLIGICTVGCKDDSNTTSSKSAPSESRFLNGISIITLDDMPFSTANNVTRFKSDGSLLIRSEYGNTSLRIILTNFVGDGEYPFAFSNVIQFYSATGEISFYEGFNGNMTISEYNQITGSFNAQIDALLFDYGSPETSVLKGELNNFKIIDMEEPQIGEALAFHSESIFDYCQHEVILVGEDRMSLDFYNRSGDTLRIQDILDIISPKDFKLQLGSESTIEIEQDEILSWEYNEAENLVSGHFKKLDEIGDFELWFTDLPVQSTIFDSQQEVLGIENQDTIHYEYVYFSKTLSCVDDTYRYHFLATDSSNYLTWEYSGEEITASQSVTVRYQYEVINARPFFFQEFDAILQIELVNPQTQEYNFSFTGEVPSDRAFFANSIYLLTE
ncbi:MAG: hypothetical protein AAGC47_01550 [Bacteroidota bacterium]